MIYDILYVCQCYNSKDFSRLYTTNKTRPIFISWKLKSQDLFLATFDLQLLSTTTIVFLYFCNSAHLCFCYSVFLYFCISALLCFCYSVFLYFCISSPLCFCYSVLMYFCISALLCFCYFVFLYFWISALLCFCYSVFLYFSYSALLCFCNSVFVNFLLLCFSMSQIFFTALDLQSQVYFCSVANQLLRAFYMTTLISVM